MRTSLPSPGMHLFEQQAEQTIPDAIPQRIAITGGRGRLAGLVAAFLRARGHEVTLFSRTPGEGFHPIEKLFQPALLSEYTAMLHMAWSSVPFTSEQDPGREEREDMPLLKKLLAGVSEIKNSPTPKFIFLSSASVYGNTGDIAANELAPCHPLSGYARAKLQAEGLIQAAVMSHSSIKALLLRVTNVIGFPADPQRPQGILPRIFAATREKQPLEIWGDGCCSKDYLWSDDFLAALEVSIIHPLRGIFNIGSGNNFSLKELVSLVEEQKKVSISIVHRPHYVWDVSKAYIDSSAFREVTGWEPRVDIRDAIQQMSA